MPSGLTEEETAADPDLEALRAATMEKMGEEHWKPKLDSAMRQVRLSLEGLA